MLKNGQYSNALPKDLRQIAKEYQKKALNKFELNQKKIDEHVAKKVIQKEQVDEIDLSTMTKKQSEELKNGPKQPTKKEIESFFEKQIDQKGIFLGQLLTVANVFPREKGVAVEFLCPSSRIHSLVFALKEREKRRLKPYSVVKIDDEDVEIYGEVQLGINEKFKVLFPC